MVEKPYFSPRTTQYTYFDTQLGGPTWAGKKILDFGGNVGGFLVGAPSCIDPVDYWCLDLHKPAIERGRASHPRAHFVYYDRYQSDTNLTGTLGLPVPEIGQMFDIILAFSVFTHTSIQEMLDLSDQLMAMLNPGGIFAFTIFDPNYDPLKDPTYDRSNPPINLHLGSNLRHRLIRKKEEYPNVDVDALLEKAKGARWYSLMGGELR